MSVDIQEKVEQILVDGFCILRNQFPRSAIEDCNEAFALILRDYVVEHADNPNRGPARHYIALPFERRCIIPVSSTTIRLSLLQASC